MEKFVQIEKVGRPSTPRKGKFVALRDIDLTIKAGRVHRADRPLRLRQIDAAQPDRRPDPADHGVLLLEGREIAGPGPERAVVFQNHSLLPWLTCFENVYLAVERVFGAKEGKQKLKERTAAAINWSASTTPAASIRMKSPAA
jgi:nitrate/nitrite transport system ATP-binding protein